jgi:hypothetical protein
VPRPKYQVFVSSTYTDLVKERQEVMWQILKARHIPAGMEWFASADDRGWEIIRRMIDQADYYVLLIAGRYGSVDPAYDMSWTEREYRYAIEKGVPVLGFVRERDAITADHVEATEDGRRRLEVFVKTVRDKHLVQSWRQAADLGAHVAAALHSSIIDDEDSGRSRPGWYHGTDVPASDALTTIERLRGEVEMLRQSAERAGTQAEPAFEELLRYFQRFDWHNDFDGETTLLWELYEGAAEIGFGPLTEPFSKHFLLHGLAEWEEDRLVLSPKGRAFIARLAMIPPAKLRELIIEPSA